MTLSINTNISAMTAQRYLGVNNMKTASSLAKLSSGSRVPTAKDDAAALAIGSQLRAEVSGLQQASQNASQAVSMLQIADGALSTVGDILVRMKSLATQASSGQLGTSERSLLNQEFTRLSSEIGRISLATEFNGTQLLNGGERLSTQTELTEGGLDAQGINLSFNTSETGDDEAFRVEYNFDNTGDDSGNMTVTNVTTGESQTIDIKAAVQTVTGEANTAFTTNLGAGETASINFAAIGVTVELNDTFDVDADFNFPPTLTATVGAPSEVTAITATAAYQDGTFTGANLATLKGLAAFDTNTGNLNIAFTGDAATTNLINITATTGLEFSTDGLTYAATLADVPVNTAIYVALDSTDEAFARIDVTAITAATGTTAGASFDLSLDGLVRSVESDGDAATFNYRVGTGIDANTDEIAVTISSVSETALNINGLDITTVGNAETAMGRVTTAINTVSSRRADIGASQSRLEFAASSINVTIENTAAAQSGLLDVDVSSEMTTFTSKQVLMQAGISMLAQANQQPALLLRLLQ